MRFLIIEDNRDLADLIRNTLESECWTADMAHDGETGFFLARTENYDCIILDINLPGKNGEVICKELRKMGNTVPIIMLTVRKLVENKISGLDAGADDYLVKPIVLGELLARIRAITRRPKQLLKTDIVWDDITLSLERQELKKGKKYVYLTRKEFALLEFFVRRKGELITRSELLEHVWDAKTDPYSNTIEAHITNLRRKIDQPNESYIRNIPGRGYILDIHSS